MEYLAYLHSALAYEETLNIDAVNLLSKLNFLSFLKQQKCICKAWLYSLSLSLTLVLLKMSSSVLALQMGEQGYQINNSASNLVYKVEPKQNLTKKSLTSNLSDRPQQEDHSYIKGKLHLVNDTPYIALFLLYKPGEQQPNRYAKILPCSKVILRSRYSNLWRVNFNGQPYKIFIGKFYNKNKKVFELKTSQINQIAEQKQSCQSKQKLTTIQFINSTEFVNFDDPRLFTGAITSAKSSMKIAQVSFDNLNLVKAFTELADVTNELNSAFMYLKSKWEMANLPDEDVTKLKNIVEETRNSTIPPQKLDSLIQCISLVLGDKINKENWANFQADILVYNQVEKEYSLVSNLIGASRSLGSLLTFNFSGGQISKELEACRKGALISYKFASNTNSYTRCIR